MLTWWPKAELAFWPTDQTIDRSYMYNVSCQLNIYVLVLAYPCAIMLYKISGYTCKLKNQYLEKFSKVHKKTSLTRRLRAARSLYVGMVWQKNGCP